MRRGVLRGHSRRLMQVHGHPHIGAGVGDLPHKVRPADVPDTSKSLRCHGCLFQLRKPLLPAHRRPAPSSLSAAGMAHAMARKQVQLGVMHPSRAFCAPQHPHSKPCTGRWSDSSGARVANLPLIAGPGPRGGYRT